jgi:hypothetical protein
MDGFEIDEDLPELLDSLQLDGGLLGRNGSVGRFDDRVAALRDGATPSGAHREVVADTMEPCRWIVGDASRGDLDGQAEEGVLREVFSLAWITRDARKVTEE